MTQKLKIGKQELNIHNKIRWPEDIFEQNMQNPKTTYTFVSVPGAILFGLGMCGIVASSSGLFPHPIYSAGALACSTVCLATGLMFFSSDDNAYSSKHIQPVVKPEKGNPKYTTKKKLAMKQEKNQETKQEK